MQVHIFIPCFVDQFFPQTGSNMLRVLQHLGHHIISEKLPLCCGQAACNAGFNKEAYHVYQRFLKYYLRNPAPIIVPSASCAAFLKYQAPGLAPNKSNQKNSSLAIYEFTDFIMQHSDLSAYDFSYPHRVAYHSSCSSLRAYPLQDKVKKVLAYVRDLDLAIIPENEVCCGFGGSFSIKFGSISASMAKEKINHIFSLSTHKILSTDMSCLLHLSSFVRENNLESLHIADLLSAAIKE